MNEFEKLLKYLARYMAVIATVMLVADAVLSFLLTGSLQALVSSNSSYGLEQAIGWFGYFVQTLLSPAAVGFLYALALACYLTARSIEGSDSK